MTKHKIAYIAVLLAGAILFTSPSFPQDGPDHERRPLPESIRGYKLERPDIELKGSDTSVDGMKPGSLVRFGDPELARITPFGITLDVPIIVSPVKRGGRVDFLSFEDIVVNGISVDVSDYLRAFELPNDKPLRLPRPLRIFVSTTGLVGGAMEEFAESKERWRVTGRVYVFGRFRKYLMRFKRVVPIEVDIEILNPLKPDDRPGR